MPPGPTPHEEGFDPKKWSPSRANTLLGCGIEFELKYIQKLPEEGSGSAALFGSVVHQALEWWTPDRSQNLLTLMRKAWPEVARQRNATVVEEFLEQYKGLSVQAIRMEHQIREEWASRGKESKAPRMTKQFKESKVSKDIEKLVGKFSRRIEAESPWRFSEYGTLPGLFDESLVLAKRYEEKWQHLSPTILTEFGFEVPFRGFVLKGYIDCVEPLYDKKAQEWFVGVTDYKTYAREPAEQKDWRQKVMYVVAINYLIGIGQIILPAEYAALPIRAGIDYCRLLRRDYCTMVSEDFDRLERELTQLSKMAEEGIFLPAEKSRNADFCSYGSLCCLRNTKAAGGSAEIVEVEL